MGTERCFLTSSSLVLPLGRLTPFSSPETTTYFISLSLSLFYTGRGTVSPCSATRCRCLLFRKWSDSVRIFRPLPQVDKICPSTTSARCIATRSTRHPLEWPKCHFMTDKSQLKMAKYLPCPSGPLCVFIFLFFCAHDCRTREGCRTSLCQR